MLCFNVAGGVSPGRSGAWGRPRRFDTVLQCGRGSIPRKVVESKRSRNLFSKLQCGRGSIPRKVAEGRRAVSPGGEGFNVAGGVSPGRSGWTGFGMPTPSGFNVAGGVSPGRSTRTLTRRGWRSWSFNVAGGVSPGRSGPKWPPSSASTHCFNVAGGVSPGRSGVETWNLHLTPKLQCGRGSIPRKVSAEPCRRARSALSLQCGRGSIPRKVDRGRGKPSPYQ